MMPLSEKVCETNQFDQEVITKKWVQPEPSFSVALGKTQ